MHFGLCLRLLPCFLQFFLFNRFILPTDSTKCLLFQGSLNGTLRVKHMKYIECETCSFDVTLVNTSSLLTNFSLGCAKNKIEKLEGCFRSIIKNTKRSLEGECQCSRDKCNLGLLIKKYPVIKEDVLKQLRSKNMVEKITDEKSENELLRCEAKDRNTENNSNDYDKSKGYMNSNDKNNTK